MQNYWSEIRSDLVDEEFICYIDTWRKGEEQGQTIAWVDMLSGCVIYACPEARIDVDAQEVIQETVKEAKKEHPYSLNHLEDILKGVVKFECDEIGSDVDVKLNLSSMGFSEEEMVFFGFPEYLD